MRLPRLLPREEDVERKDEIDTEVTDEELAKSIEERSEQLAYASQWKLMWIKFRRHRVAFIAGIVIALFYIGAIFAEFFSPYDPNERFTEYALAPPTTVHFVDQDGNFYLRPFVYDYEKKLDEETFQRYYEEIPTERHPIRFFVRGSEYKLLGVIPMDLHLYGAGEGKVFLLGTDQQGRDMVSQLIFGGRISLSIGLMGVIMSFVIGIILGGISGYLGGTVDNVIQRLIEILRSFPTLPLWMALSAALPADWPVMRLYFAITLLLSLLGWTTMARVVRGKFLALREEDYVAAADIAGASPRRIMFRHMLPSFISHLIASASLSIPGMILGETSLSFLGLGLRRPAISWGVLLQQAQNIHAVALAPWLLLSTVPVILTVLAFNFFGDGVRDAADPYG